MNGESQWPQPLPRCLLAHPIHTHSALTHSTLLPGGPAPTSPHPAPVPWCPANGKLLGPAGSSPQAIGHWDTLLSLILTVPAARSAQAAPMVLRPSAWPSPTSQTHTSQGSAPGWKLSPGSYFRPACSQSWGWGKSRTGPGSLQLAAMPGVVASSVPQGPQPPGFGCVQK